jgi:predicted dehydrogenase/nucleoside-diphosphate-sugar epimerase
LAVLGRYLLGHGNYAPLHQERRYQRHCTASIGVMSLSRSEINPPKTGICLVGTGFIAHAHAEAIQNLPNLSLVTVVDTDSVRARQFAARWGVDHVYANIEEALERRSFDRVHVLVPPPAHAAVTLHFLNASLPTLVEKPLASTAAEANRMVEAARSSSTRLGVNQNALLHPALHKLVRHLTAGDIGRLEYVDCVYNMPLRQLQARLFGHWMFAEPQNILLEQAVHPLSQILALAGPTLHVEAKAGPPREIAQGVAFYPTCDVTLQCEHAPAHLRFTVGASYPMWQIRVVGTDGLITADMIRNRVLVSGRSRWLDGLDDLLSGLGAAEQMIRHSTANALAYGGSLAGLGRRADPFFRSMAASIEAFHAACDSEGPMPADGAFGLSLISLCERIAGTAFQPAPKSRLSPLPRRSNQHDVAILGGTGFIGRAVVARLLERQPGLGIGVMGRNLANLPEVLHQDRVQLIAGDVTSEADVSNAIDSAPVVINLAHGGGGETWSEIERRMVGSARTVASICLSQKTELLIHIGSIAALYLGDGSEVITGQTPLDSQPYKRAPYARAKALTDQLLMDWHRERGLPICILRPGLVMGEGGSPFHSGLGFFNNEQHCLGWNQGRNPLPFVLVEDVAEAIARAAVKSDLSGRSLNLVGDVAMTGREYMDELALALKRPLKFHGQSPAKLYMVELCKWGVKRFAGPRDAPPSYHDLLSRGCLARFDCSDAKAALDWAPGSDREAFIESAIRVHVSRSCQK